MFHRNRRNKSNNQSPAHRARRRLFLELLENRQLMASDLTWRMFDSANGKTLEIDGNEANNTIIVRETSPTSRITIDGIAGDFARPDQLVIRGYGGIDAIYNDTSIGSILDGGAGNFDELTGGNGDDILRADSTDRVVRGRNGRDVLEVAGTTSNDVLIARLAQDGVRFENVGVAWNFIGTGFETLKVSGLSGDDVIYNDTNMPMEAFGGEGNDTITGGSASDWLYGDGDNDFIRGRGSNDEIRGGSGDDRLFSDLDDSSDNHFISEFRNGRRGSDSLNGEEGKDILDGSTSVDSFAWNDGTLFITGTNLDDQIVLRWNDGFLYVDGMRRVWQDPKNVTVFGGAGNDTIYNDCHVGLIARGEEGNDTITGGTWADELIGGTGNDTLRGRQGGDTLLGGDGDDWLYGHLDDASDTGQADYLEGGVGEDRLEGSPLLDLIDSQSSTLRFGGSEKGDTLQVAFIPAGTSGVTTWGHIEIAGVRAKWRGQFSIFPDGVGYSPSQIVVSGAAGHDTISFNGSFNVLIAGNSGNDTLVSTSTSAVFAGGSGIDTIQAVNGNGTLSFADAPSAVRVVLPLNSAIGDGTDTFAGIANVIGSNYDDILVGDGLANRLEGGAGNDALVGRDGNDVLIGGAGDDWLDGGVGTDTADYASAANPVVHLVFQSETVGDGRDQLVAVESVENVLESLATPGRDLVVFYVYGHGGIVAPADVARHVNGLRFDRGDQVDNVVIQEANWNDFHRRKNPSATPFVGSTDKAARDIAAVLDTYSDPGDVVILAGHSLGGDTVLNAAQRTHVQIDLLVTLDPVGTATTTGLDNVATRHSLHSRYRVPANVQFFYNRWQTKSAYPLDFKNTGLLNSDAGLSAELYFDIPDQAHDPAEGLDLLTAHAMLPLVPDIQADLIRIVDGLRNGPPTVPPGRLPPGLRS